jgi:hypothetical protein
MTQSGSAADKWIACDLVLANGHELCLSDYGILDDSKVHRVEVVAELDTGCRHLGLPTAVVAALNLQLIDDNIKISSVLDGENRSVAIFGPVAILFQGQRKLVDAYELKFASNVLLGLEPAQRLKIDVDWKNSLVYLPATGYPHSAFTIAPEDLLCLFGTQSETIIDLQKKHKVSIEISNRRKVDKIVVTICTGTDRKNIRQAVEAIGRLCPSLSPAPEEERH